MASTERTEDFDAILRIAFREASGIDALHVAAAHLLKADELITTEKPGKLLNPTR